MKTWYLVIDVEKCENCNNCFLSCKDEHVGNDWPGYAAAQPGQGRSWITISTNERGQFPLIDVAYRPAPCMHCDNPPCIKAAGDGAIYKRPDGIVIIDPVKAKGRKELPASCPYGAIQWNEALELPQKCTLCAHLLDEGWTQTRCVQSCPTGALSLRHAEESQMQETVRTEKLEVYEPQRGTNPRVYYRNLYRFARCFIAGSVAAHTPVGDECVEAAKVTLLNGSGQLVAGTTTDNYGDFKLDDLEENSGPYRLRISASGYTAREIDVELKKSVNAGDIFL